MRQSRVVHHTLQRRQCAHQPKRTHQHESDRCADPPVPSPCLWLALRCMSGHLQSTCESVNVCKKANFTPTPTERPAPVKAGLWHAFDSQVRRYCRSLSDTPRSATKLSTPHPFCILRHCHAEITKAKKKHPPPNGSGCFQHLCKATRGWPCRALITSVGPSTACPVPKGCG